MGEFSGKVAYITGIGRGQGRNHALRLAAEGAAIIGIDIAGPVAAHPTYPPATSDDLAETISLVEDLGGKIIARQGDTRDLAGQTEFLAEAVTQLGGRLDIVIANAGILAWGKVHELSEEQWNDVIDVNLSGTWKTLKAAIPLMLNAGNGGSIIIISSVAGLKAMPVQASYSASKFGLRGLSQTAAKELGADKIRVNTIHPYGVATAMALEDSTALEVLQMPRFTSSFTPILETGMATADDISDLVLFLASDKSSTITAAEFEVDMGNSKV